MVRPASEPPVVGDPAPGSNLCLTLQVTDLDLRVLAEAERGPLAAQLAELLLGPSQGAVQVILRHHCQAVGVKLLYSLAHL